MIITFILMATASTLSEQGGDNVEKSSAPTPAEETEEQQAKRFKK